MPQDYTAPSEDQFGDRASGGLDPIKKKKKPEVADTRGELQQALEQQQQHDQVLQGATLTTNAIKRDVRQYLQGELVGPAARQQVLNSISRRASLLSPKLLALNPNLAAELLLGDVKTRNLQEVSHAAFEGWREQQMSQARAQAQDDARQAYAADPDGFRVMQAINRDPVTLEYAQRAETLDPEQQGLFMTNLLNAAQMPDGPERDAAISLLPMWYAYAQRGELEVDKSLLGQAVDAVGRGLSLVWNVTYGKYIWLASHAADFVGDHGPEFIKDPLNTVQGYAGGALKTTETAIQFGTRNVEGALTLAEDKFQDYALGVDNGINLTPDQLWTSWGEVEDGNHGPVVEALAQGMGTTPDDPQWQGLFGAVDLTADLGIQILTFKALSAFKLSIRATQAGGGAFTGEAYMNSEALGGARVGRVGWDLIKNLPTPEARISALMGKFKKGMTPTLARDAARATSHDSFVRLMADGLTDISARELPLIDRAIESVTTELADATRSRPGIGNLAEIEALKAERIRLEQRKVELTNAEVIYEFPRISHVRPFMRGVGLDSWTGRMLNGIFGESGRLDLSTWTNDLTGDAHRLEDPTSTLKPANWASSNIDIIRKTMNILRVSKDVQAKVIADMFRVERGELTFFEWRTSINEAFRKGKRYNPEMEPALRFSDASIEARTHSPVERRFGEGRRDTKLENAAVDEHGNPQPTRPSQLLDHAVSMPEMRALESGARAISRFDRWAKNKPYIGKLGHGLRTSTTWAHLVLFEIPRLVLRPGLLVSQLPRLFTKIEFDQSIRAFLDQMVSPLDWFDGRLRKALTREKTEIDPVTGAPLQIGTLDRLADPVTKKPDMTAIGVVATEALSDVTAAAGKMSTAGLELRPKDVKLAMKSIHTHIEELMSDPLARRVALTGPERTLAWLESHPERKLSIDMRERIMPNLETKGYTLEQVVRDLDTEISQAAGGDLALRRAIGTRRWKGFKDQPTTAAYERTGIADELAQARQQLSLTEDPIMRREINLRIEELERRDAWLSNRPQTQKDISVENAGQFRAQLEENWRAGAYDMPNELIVKRPTLRDESVPTTRAERTRAQAQRINRVLYKGFKPASRVTWNMSRGSTFRVVAERIEARLLRMGYPLEQARFQANARAVFITKDLHYDISARSTMDRRLQNYFWFSPVWREQLAVYLGKIPQKAFWAPGLALEVGMAHTFIQGLKSMGLVQDKVVFTDPNTGEETLHPFFVLPNGASMDVGGLNPLTPATEEVGKPPTLSPGAEMILDFTATHLPEELRPFVEGITEFFSFDGDVEHGVNVIPRTLTVIPEWFGLHIPSETFSNWVDYDNKVDIQVKKLAMSQMAEEGTLPPTPGDYANEHSYDVAMSQYREELDGAVRDLEKGIFGTHLLARILIPGSVKSEGTDLYAEDSAANAFYDWRNTLDPNLPTDEYYLAVNKYVAKHPEAFPYTVGSHDYQGTRTGKWYETEAYRNSPLLDDNAYVDKALDQVHYWAEDAPKADADPVNNTKDFNNLSKRRQARLVAEWMTDDVQDLTETQASAVGLPKFYGRDDLLRTIGDIEDQFAEQDSSAKSEEANALFAAHRQYMLEKAAGQYGDAGKAVLNYMTGTPAQRLNRSGYFTGTQASVAIARASAVKRDVLAQYPTASMAGAAESYKLDVKKADFFSAIDRMRQEDPEFDRQMRYAELGLGKNDTPLGRVSAYQILFFGEPFYDKYQAPNVLEEMN